MLLRIGLTSAQSSSTVVSFGRYLSRAREQRKLLFTSTTFQWLSGTQVLLSDENTGRHTCRYRGDGGEGSTLGAVFFAYKNKKATLYLSGLSGLAHGQRRTTKQYRPAGIASLFDHLIRLRKHIRRNRETDLFRRFEIDDKFKLRCLLDR